MEDTTFEFSISNGEITGITINPIPGTQPNVIENVVIHEAVGALDEGFDSLMNEITGFIPARVPLALLLIVLVIVGFFRIL